MTDTSATTTHVSAILVASDTARLDSLTNDRAHELEVGVDGWPDRSDRGDHLLGIDAYLLVWGLVLVSRGLLSTSHSMLVGPWFDVCCSLSVAGLRGECAVP